MLSATKKDRKKRPFLVKSAIIINLIIIKKNQPFIFVIYLMIDELVLIVLVLLFYSY